MRKLFPAEKGFFLCVTCRSGRCFCLRQKCSPDTWHPFPETDEFTSGICWKQRSEQMLQYAFGYRISRIDFHGETIKAQAANE